MWASLHWAAGPGAQSTPYLPTHVALKNEFLSKFQRFASFSNYEGLILAIYLFICKIVIFFFFLSWYFFVFVSVRRFQ